MKASAVKTVRLDANGKDDKINSTNNVALPVFVLVLVILALLSAPFFIGIGFLILGDSWMRLNEETGEYFAVSPVRITIFDILKLSF